MKKYIAVAVIAAVTMGTITACGGKDIGQVEAKKIAFTDAGVSESDAGRLRVNKDRDDGRALYEVDFSVDGKEYNYEIAASDGEILNAEVEEDPQSSLNQGNGNVGDTVQNNQQNPTQDTPNNNGGVNAGTANVAVSEEDAKKTALERVPGAAESDLRMQLEYDDGYYVYEGDIIYEQKEYEFEIDAQTGNFLKWNEERY